VTAESEKERGSEHEPWDHTKKGLRGGFDEKKCSDQTADETRDQERNENPARELETTAISAAAGGRANPERKGVCGVSRNRGNTGEQQRGKRYKTSAAGDGIHGSAHRSREEKEDGV